MIRWSIAFLVLAWAFTTPARAAAEPQWAMNATIIEACSCPMFCQCYFNHEPAAQGEHAAHGGGEHFCRFNMGYRINEGSFGDTKLDGAKFWIAGDLGGDFSKGQMDWAVLFFDPSVTPAQRQAIQTIVGHVYPVKWNSFSIGKDANIDWNNDKDHPVARADGGKTAEVVLNRFPGLTNDPIVIKNLRYWGTPRNDGFLMMPNQVQALRVAPADKKAFEFKNSNGFVITIDIKSSDVKAG